MLPVLVLLAAAPTLFVPEAYRKLPAPVVPEWTPELATLGRTLFKDKRLSADGTISCESCHDPSRAFTDGRRKPVGLHGEVGIRNAPTLLNRALGTSQFWDGRAATLEEQALSPIENPIEMGRTMSDVLAFLNKTPEYSAAFRKSFHGPATAERVASALAA